MDLPVPDMKTKCENIASVFTLTDAETGKGVMGGGIRLKGCSVNIGFGSGESSISIDMVTDSCLKNEDGSPMVVIIPPLGTPVVFTCNCLVFGGIISSLSYSESSGGFEYRVKIIDPKKVLEGVTVLLSTYYCDVIPNAIVANFVNVNKLLEDGVAYCPPGLDTESWPRVANCSNYGKAGGFQGPFLWAALEKIQQNYGTIGGSGFYTTNGRKIYINIAGLVALLKKRALYARASSGMTETLLGLITDACELLSCDYIILLEGLVATLYLIDRTIDPMPGEIRKLIAAGQNAGKMITANIGQDEIYAQSNKIILGPSVQYLAERSNGGGGAGGPPVGASPDGEPADPVKPQAPVEPDSPGRSTESKPTPTPAQVAAAEEAEKKRQKLKEQEEIDAAKADPKKLKQSLGTAGSRGGTNLFAMMLGEDLYGNPVRVYNANFTALINVLPIVEILLDAGRPVGFGPMFPVKEEEILCSATLELWRLYGLKNPNSLCAQVQTSLGIRGMLGPTIDALEYLLNNPVKFDKDGIPIADEKEVDRATHRQTLLGNQAIMHSNTGKNFTAILENAVWNWFNSFIDEYYGKKWLIPMNGICVHPFSAGVNKIVTGEKYTLTDQPTDSGYPSIFQETNLLGLTPGYNTAMFEKGDGTYTGFGVVRKDLSVTRIINKNIIPHTIDFGDMSPSDFQIIGNNVYHKITVEETLYKNEALNQPEVLITTSMIPMIPRRTGREVSKAIKAYTYLFGVDQADDFHKRGPGNLSAFNILGARKATAGFQYALIPMISNIYVYGPWISTKNTVGSTTVSQDQSLNPWACGGWETMQKIGTAMAAQGVRSSNVEESGSMELAEPPGYSIGYFIDRKILLDSIVLTYGSGGATTSYSFRQYAQKFGSYAQTLAAMVKKGVEDRKLVLNKLRILTLASKGRRGEVSKEQFTDFIHNPKEENPQKASPGFCLVGKYVIPKTDKTSTTAPKTPTSITPSTNPAHTQKCSELCKDDPGSDYEPGTEGSLVTNSHGTHLFDNNDWGSMSHEDKNDLQNSAALSLDALFAPVSIAGRNGRLPGYAYTSSTESSGPPMPPTNLSPGLSISRTYMNPILNKKLLETFGDRKNNSDVGVYISRISFGTDITKIASAGGDRYDDAEDFGFFALKGPLVLQSWGYDTNGKPIPNEADVETAACSGTFTGVSLTDKFMKNWLGSPRTWPVAPIDLRFDRDRNVWVSPPSYRIVVARLTSTLAPLGTASAVLVNPAEFLKDSHISGSKGEDLVKQIDAAGGVTITINDYLGVETKAGTMVYAMYNNKKYIILGSTGGSKLSIVGPEVKQKLDQVTGSYVIDKLGKPDECKECGTVEEEFCPTDVCGLSDCVKDLYGRTLKPVVAKYVVGEVLLDLEPPFQEADVKIPWGGTKKINILVSHTKADWLLEANKDYALDVQDGYAEEIDELTGEKKYKTKKLDPEPGKPSTWFNNGYTSIADLPDVGPFGRKSGLLKTWTFASGVLGIDGDGCLKIYPLTTCAIVVEPSSPTPPAPAPGGGGTSVPPATPSNPSYPYTG